jgi:hypothetical protein
MRWCKRWFSACARVSSALMIAARSTSISASHFVPPSACLVGSQCACRLALLFMVHAPSCHHWSTQTGQVLEYLLTLEQERHHSSVQKVTQPEKLPLVPAIRIARTGPSRHRPQRGEQPMPFDHHRPSLVASISQTRSGAITSGGAAVNIRLTDWDDHRSRPRQQRDIAMRAVTVPPRPR